MRLASTRSGTLSKKHRDIKSRRTHQKKEEANTTTIHACIGAICAPSRSVMSLTSMTSSNACWVRTPSLGSNQGAVEAALGEAYIHILQWTDNDRYLKGDERYDRSLYYHCFACLLTASETMLGSTKKVGLIQSTSATLSCLYGR